MSKHPTLLQQFRSFCFQNNATHLETAIEYFAVFGGMGWKIDMSKPLDQLIEEKVLKNYRYIHGDITKITRSNPTHHKVLSALAMGDRREHSAFKKARVQKEEGENSVDFLVEHGLLVVEKSVEKPLKNYEKISNKVLFTQPFMRFWFSAISPYYKGIKEGDYSEFKKQWSHTQQEFSHLIYQQLVMALLEKSTVEDPIVHIGSYWDEHVEIDILAKTKSGKWIAGTCKHSKNKANKSELTKLKESVAKAELNVDTYVVYSKNKFSQELKKEKGATLRLFSLNSIGNLLEELSDKDMLVNTNKKY
ncbi:DUF234 domain-containing protein [bacterium]|nr:DUF234 domain-containing protein [bacterium]MBU1958871.1 DUF234 domain-containing protein [bacterium]